MACIGIGYAEYDSGFLPGGDKFRNFTRRSRYRLVHDDVDAVLHESEGDGSVQMVGSDDRDSFDTVRAGRFPLRHLPEIGIAPLVFQQPFPTGCPGSPSVGRKRSSDDLPSV